MKVCAAVTHLKLEKNAADVQSERIVEKWRREMSQVSVDFPGERQGPGNTATPFSPYRVIPTWKTRKELVERLH
jgi:hypothetical protein